MLDFLAALNSLSPLAVIGLMGLTVYTLVQQKRLTPNGEHLQALRDMSRKLDTCAEGIQRMEVTLAKVATLLERELR